MATQSNVITRWVSSNSVSSLPLIVKLVQFVEDVLHLLNWSDQISNSEVVGTWLLVETTAWDSHDACLVDHVHAVEEVWLDTLGVSFVDELLGEVHAWETVHGTLDLGAGHVLHVVKGAGEQVCFDFKG